MESENSGMGEERARSPLNLGRRVSGLAQLLLTFLVFLTASMAALGTPLADDKALAKGLYEKAREAFTNEDYDAAIQMLEQAYQFDADPVILYSLARSYEGKGELLKAQSFFEEVQANPATPANLLERVPEDIQRVSDLIESTLSPIEITSTPAGARVIVDGVEVGETPFVGTLPPGEHTVLVALEGFATVEDQFVSEGGTPLNVDLVLVSTEAGMSGMLIGSFVGFGVGAAGLATGIAMFAVADGTLTDLNKERAKPQPDQGRINTLTEDGKTSSLVSVVGYAVGGVGLAAGTGLLIWWLLDDTSTETSADAIDWNLGLDPTSGAVSIELRW